MSTELILASVIFVAIGLILVSVFALSKFVGPNNENSKIKNTVYESGVSNPVGTTNIRFSVKFYLVAISFLLSATFSLKYLFPLLPKETPSFRAIFDFVNNIFFISL